MSFEILGCDVSWWQGIINFLTMKLAGADYVFIRAGSLNRDSGVMYHDYCVATNALGAQEVGLKKGFYWYYREFGIEKAKQQARYFWDIVNSPDWTIEEGLVCDVEVWDAKAESVKAFMTELALVSGLPVEKLGIYTRASLWNPTMGSPIWALQYFLWIARYHSGINHPWEDNDKFRALPWIYARYWQKSADGNNRGEEFGVSSDDVDLNLKWYEGEPEPEPEPDVEEEECLPHDALYRVYTEAKTRGWPI